MRVGIYFCKYIFFSWGRGGGGKCHYKIRSRDSTLVESFCVVEKTVKILEKVLETIGEIVYAKVKNVLQENSGL